MSQEITLESVQAVGGSGKISLHSFRGWQSSLLLGGGQNGVELWMNAWLQIAPSVTYQGESFCYVMPNPDIFNPNKNSMGTNRFGLTKFDCTFMTPYSCTSTPIIGTSKPYPFWHSCLKTTPFMAQKLPKAPVLAYVYSNKWECTTPPPPGRFALNSYMSTIQTKGLHIFLFPDPKMTTAWMMLDTLPWLVYSVSTIARHLWWRMDRQETKTQHALCYSFCLVQHFYSSHSLSPDTSQLHPYPAYTRWEKIMWNIVSLYCCSYADMSGSSILTENF